ncbi:MAG: class I SAM-dependent methyltransferase [Chloroflexi bacterium]|nr:class I SAM-dependent methyltransferase [Chloroflexota bacterium]
MLNRIRRFGFRLLYNECAFAYDVVSHVVSLGRWRNWQRCVMQFLPEPNAGVVLELAHGAGDLQVDLTKAGYRTAGLDLSRAMGRLARRKLTKQGIGAALIQGEAACLPVPSNSIAALVSTFPTAFIFAPKTQSEIERVLKPEGRAVILYSALMTRTGILATAIRSLYRLTGQTYTRIPDSEIRRLFHAPGLTVEAHTVHLGDSLAQLVVLRNTPNESQSRRDISLELARES